MRSRNFYTNKYFIAFVILVLVLMVDVFLHRGMSRVILPESFTDKREAQHPEYCMQPLIIKNKDWVKAVNTKELIQGLDSTVAGLEMDVYFDINENRFFIYHDSSNISVQTLQQQLTIYQNRKLTASIWLDFKNLSETNEFASLKKLKELRNEFRLQNKLIVESPNIQHLNSFCENAFYTSFYVPYFNPYLMTEDDIVKEIDTIGLLLKNNKVSALSGYYFQIPMLKKFFPTANLLTWAENSSFSLIAPVFNHQLSADNQIKIVLH